MGGKLGGLQSRFRKRQRELLKAEQKRLDARVTRSARNWDDVLLPESWHTQRVAKAQKG